MANTTIKITQLPSIGNALAANTVLPVVNTAGTAITQKTTVGNIANFTLSQAGNSLPPAFLSSLAYSVANAAQPNITSVGTLNINTLHISGGTNGQYLQTDGTGNLSWAAGGSGGNGSPGGSNTQVQFNNAGTFGGAPNFTYNSNTTTLTVPNISSPINSNLYVSASNSSLTWIFGMGGALVWPGNTSHAIEANSDDEFEIHSHNNVVISTDVANANNHFTFGGDGNLTLPLNTSSINYANGQPYGGGGGGTGNIGFTNNAIYNLGGVIVENADLSHGATAALSIPNNANTITPLQLTNTYGDVALTAGTSPSELNTWTFDKYGTIIFPDGTVAQGDIEGTGNFGFEMPANVGFGILTDLGNREWTFGANGTVTLAGDINSKPSNGFAFSATITNITTGNPTVIVDVSSNVFPAPVTGQVTISGVIGTSEANDVWYYQAVEANQFQLFSDAACTIPVDGTSWTAYISGGNAYASQFSSLAISTNYLQVVAGGESWTFDNSGQINLPTQSNSFNKGRIQSYNGYPTLLGYGSDGEHGGPELDWMNSDDPATAFMNANVLRNTLYINDGGLYVGMNENYVANVAVASWRFSPNGSTYFPTLDVDLHNGGVQSAQTLKFGDNSQQAVITGPTPPTGSGQNAQRLIIQGQRGDTTGEGGDVYLWAGDADNYAGDIKIYAGDADNVSLGYGGYINIEGGQGFNEGGYVNIIAGRSTNSAGAYASVVGGIGNTIGGSANLVGGQGGVAGGTAYVQGGYGGGSGGSVNITGGAAGNGLAEYGNVNINAGASTWSFDNAGNLILPQGGSIFSMNSTPSGNPGNTIVLQPAGSGVTTNQQLKVYPTAADGDHIHMTSGNLYQTELFLGDDNLYVKLANTGNIVLNSNDGTGNTAQIVFDVLGNTTFPGNLLYTGASPAPTINGFGSATFVDGVVANTLSSISGLYQAGVPTVINDGINAIYTGASTTMDVFGFPFTQRTRGQLTIAGDITPTEALGTWYYQSVNTVTFEIFTDSTYSTPVDSTSWAAYSGGATVYITKNLPAANLTLDSNGFLTTFDNTGNITAPGNIKVNGTTGNLVFGRATATGSPGLSSTSSITFAANRAGTVKEMTLGTSGDLSLSGNISTSANISGGNFIGNGDTLSNVATQTTGSWTLATGVNTVSLSVPGPGTYSIWVNGNIPNGIITYTATGVVTNNNVPVLGSQYGWYYLAGNALVLTSMPNQFAGTSGSISTATVSTTTANVFSFGITNNSGSSQIVNWGYTKL